MNYKLGKLPAKYDKRTILLKSILKVLPPPPKEWDVDSKFGFPIPLQMFMNHMLGCCVISGRANLSLRFEAIEQGKVIAISDNDIKTEYFSQSGGADNGLVMLNSLNDWRQDGWRLGFRKIACLKIGGMFLDIHAYAAFDPHDPLLIKSCICLLNGAYMGFYVPESAMEQFKDGKIWEDVGDTNIVGGHAVTTCAYNEIGPVFLTWAKKQQATWKFMRNEKYFDEGYGVVDNKDRFIENSLIDVERLEQYLNDITG